jgi:hypothetical protein
MKLGRRFIGTELKQSYFRQACRYLNSVDGQGDLLAMPLSEPQAVA